MVGEVPPHNRENNMIWVALLASFCCGLVVGTLQCYGAWQKDKSVRFGIAFEKGMLEAYDRADNAWGDKVLTSEEIYEVILEGD